MSERIPDLVPDGHGHTVLEWIEPADSGIDRPRHSFEERDGEAVFVDTALQSPESPGRRTAPPASSELTTNLLNDAVNETELR